MGEPKPFASLTSGLLARKGAAKPAMRRQYMNSMGNLSMGHEDLGWNDMGDDAQEEDIATAQPLAGLSPMPSHVVTPIAPSPAPVALVEQPDDAADVPAVVEQRKMLVEKVANGKFEADEPAQPRKPARAKAKPTAIKQRKSKAAFTLRLDPERHLKLRLACAVANRSAQQMVIEALDELLEQWPHVEQIAEQLPARRAAGQA
jgi:hypothetical protein